MNNDDVQDINGIAILVLASEAETDAAVSDVLRHHGYSVHTRAGSGKVLQHLRNHHYDLLLLDADMDEAAAVAICRQILNDCLRTEILVMVDSNKESELAPFLELGLSHFLCRPFHASQLLYTTYAALHYRRLRRHLEKAGLGKIHGSNLVGNSESIKELRREILAVADTRLPVLILGDTGTGKEVIAHDLHRNSSRCTKFFLPINCAILGRLAESELFGHRRGAFTGAVVTTSGYIGAAEGGTLFFDEIGELPLDVQAKLLRFLDRGEYNRVGDPTPRTADVRIIAATNRDLQKMVDDGAFREDLYFRLNGTLLETVPLNKRRADILPLIYHFLDIFSSCDNIPYEISADAAAQLMQTDWPGNVRQLKQTLYRIVQASGTKIIGLAEVTRILARTGRRGPPQNYQAAKKEALHKFDKEYFAKTLLLADGSLKKALHLSGMHKSNFYTKLKRLDLSLKDFTDKH